MKKIYSNPTDISKLNNYRSFAANCNPESVFKEITIFEENGEYFHSEFMSDRIIEVTVENEKYFANV